MKAYYHTDEIYPVYYPSTDVESIVDPWSTAVEIPKNVWDKYTKALENFKKAIKEVDQYIEGKNI